MLGIKKAKIEKRISEHAIAAVINVHVNTAHRKLNGESEFTASEALKLQEALFREYTIRYLYSGIDDEREEDRV